MFSLPGYALHEQIFDSRNSLVFKAKRDSDGKRVILKVLARPFAAPDKVAQFRREFEITRSLVSPHVVEAYALHLHDGRLAMALEDFGGESLSLWRKRAQRSLEERLRVAVQIAEALHQVHLAHVIHKDVNPSNIVLNAETSELKLIDFGIATVLDAETPPLRSPTVIEGTLAYISPEQTGRMNRAMDYRTDHYSLGVTLYELFGGALPFDATDPVEMVHHHIAQKPVPLADRAPNLPPFLSAIVMKLIAKNAEDRYQSSLGVAADLRRVLDHIERGAPLSLSDLAADDTPRRFQIAQKLYGREREIELLLGAFTRVAGGGRELLLVAGEAGIGKSAVVREVVKPITEQRGYFISGKFDQFLRNVPFACLVQAFQSLVRMILTESEERIRGWRDKLLNALGENAQVIIDVIPEVGLIVGPQPELPPLQPKEAQNRFNRVFSAFISALAQKDHPLVIFLDDLQWADAASLHQLEILMSEPEARRASGALLVIGAYRNNEVGPAHALSLSIAAIRKAGGVEQAITLGPLPIASVQSLVADTLRRSTKEVEALADLVWTKTDGNPFYLSELLKSLHQSGAIFFDEKARVWSWTEDRIAEADVTGNVVDLLTSKVKRLGEDTQSTLQRAACVGNRFDLMTLATVEEAAPHVVATRLWPAIYEGLVLPLSDTYKLMTQEVQGLAEATGAEYKFAHDRVQQAVYQTLGEAERRAAHRRVGELLRANAKGDEGLFDIVNQMNLGIGGDETIEAARVLSDLNLAAGRKAKSSTAYGAALLYFKTAIALLGPRRTPGKEGEIDGADLEATWAGDAARMDALHIEATEAAFLATDFEQMERLSGVAIAHTKDTLVKAEISDVLLQAHIAQNRSKECVETGLAILKLLGSELPASPTGDDIGKSAVEAAAALAGRDPESLADSPDMKDPYRLMEMRIMNRIQPPAYRVVPAMFPLLSFKTIALLATHGNNPEAPFAYALYGLILCATGDIDNGYRFGTLSLKLLDKLHAKHAEARTRYIAKAFIGHWKDNLHSAIGDLASAYRVGIATGDYEFAGFAGLMYCCFSYFTAAPLGDLTREAGAYIQGIREIRQETPLTYTRIHHQAFLNLRGGATDVCVLAGESYDENAERATHEAASDLISFAYAALNRLILCVIFRDNLRAVRNADEATGLLGSLAAMPHVPLVHFYGALARLSRASETSGDEQRALLDKAAEDRAALDKYAKFAPENLRHKCDLVDAETARIEGRVTAAIEAYRSAIAGAGRHQFMNDEALANEAFGRFWLEQGAEEIADLYLHRAHQLYRLWGATAKVRALEDAFGAENRKGPPRGPSSKRWYGSLLADRESTLQPGLTGTLTTTTGSAFFDHRTIMKAAQAISQEIVLPNLLRNMMLILIENAGAERGVLLLFGGDKLFVEAERAVGDAEATVLQHRLFSDREPLAASIVHYVARTQETVVLHDACHEGGYVNDPYVKRVGAKSVLGMPIVHQGKILGVLYLENNVATGVFPPERVEVLGMLCAQTGISLENVMVYRMLEDKVDERTRQLKERTLELEAALEKLKAMQEQLVEQGKMASLGTLTAGIAHEMKNPLNFIINFSDLSLGITGELRDAMSAPEALDRGDVEELLEDLDQNLRKVSHHGKAANRIVESMLVHSGAAEVETKPTNLNALVDDIVALTDHRTGPQAEGRVHVERDYQQDIGDVAILPQEIGRVILNLLNNAFYSVEEKRREVGPSFTPSVKISTRCTTDTATIAIRDNGKGISRALRDKIFNPFFTTKPAGVGVGLGLSLSFDIVVKQHRGTLTVDSEEGEFAEFVITLPVAPRSPENAASEPPPDMLAE